MRKNMRYRPRQPLPFARQRRRITGLPRPIGRGQRPHAAEQTLARTSHQPDIRTILHPPHIALPLGPHLLRWLNRKGSGIATPGAVIAERETHAQRLSLGEIGTATCRARVFHVVYISVVAFSLTTNI